MTKFKKDEKRLYPRVEHALPLKIAANGYDLATTTQNISCVGAYCHIDKYVPPFTKIAIKVNLPLRADSKTKICTIECGGVIVRSTDDAAGGFNVAIFFNKINDAQRKTISKYISSILPQELSVPSTN